MVLPCGPFSLNASYLKSQNITFGYNIAAQVVDRKSLAWTNPAHLPLLRNAYGTGPSASIWIPATYSVLPPSLVFACPYDWAVSKSPIPNVP